MTQKTQLMRRRPRRATRDDVARLAEVSTAVVSYVFNNGPKNVAPATAQRVWDAARQLNYKPNAIARALSSGVSKTLGAVINDLSNPFTAGVYEELERLASARGYSMLFVMSHGDPQLEIASVNQLINRDAEAIFISPCGDVQDLPLSNEQSRFVIFDKDSTVHGAICVATDFEASMALGINHLIEHGHRNIALIIGLTSQDHTDGRIRGWYSAHQQAGLPAGKIMYTSAFTREMGYQAVIKLLEIPEAERPTAIFAGSDMLAVGALSALNQRGISVPSQMAILSFDGTVASRYTCPALTAIHQDQQQLASLALQTALENPHTDETKLIEPELIIRESCGCHIRR